eukprot:5302947-Amphidinium_carterae.1
MSSRNPKLQEEDQSVESRSFRRDNVSSSRCPGQYKLKRGPLVPASSCFNFAFDLGQTIAWFGAILGNYKGFGVFRTQSLVGHIYCVA